MCQNVNKKNCLPCHKYRRKWLTWLLWSVNSYRIEKISLKKNLNVNSYYVLGSIASKRAKQQEGNDRNVLKAIDSDDSD